MSDGELRGEGDIPTPGAFDFIIIMCYKGNEIEISCEVRPILGQHTCAILGTQSLRRANQQEMQEGRHYERRCEVVQRR